MKKMRSVGRVQERNLGVPERMTRPTPQRGRFLRGKEGCCVGSGGKKNCSKPIELLATPSSFLRGDPI